MRGFITEKDWKNIDRIFPEVHRLYRCFLRKPQTFLELLEMCHSFDNIDLGTSYQKKRRKLNELSG